MKHQETGLIDQTMVLEALQQAFKNLSAKVQFKNPVMFVTYIGALITTLYVLYEVVHGSFSWFNVQICLWLWFTVLFANFAEAIAEGRGKAHADHLRKSKIDSFARKWHDGVVEQVSPAVLKKGDKIICEAGDVIPADGDVIEGVATVDESAITGESAPVIRESGGDRSAVTAGTKVLSDKLIIQVTSELGNSFLDKMIHLIEGAKRQRTPNEIALHILLSALTIIFLLNVVSLKMFADYSSQAANQDLSPIVTLPILVALLVCLIPTTISALLGAVGIAGMDRLMRCNVIAKSGRAVEAAGDIDLLILDKTGTITIGNRMATEFIAVPRVDPNEFAKIAQLASLSDETPEGRSIVVLAKNNFNLRAESLKHSNSITIPFSAKTRMSGIDFKNGSDHIIRSIRKGAVDAIKMHIESKGGLFPEEVDAIALAIAKTGGTPLVVADNEKVVGLVHLKDVIKGGIKDRFNAMRKMGIKTIMVTGDNPLTAAAIAAEAGLDDYIAEATPEKKLALIKQEQEGGRLVAMTGDGTNDAPALAQADVAVAMNTGTQASREAGNMIDLDSSPTKLIDIVEIGKQLLMTRGALTTFSIANDVAKYFAIIPALFGQLYISEYDNSGPLALLNIMYLHSHQSAILSAVIFNALIIVALIPLALRGVKYQPHSADELLQKNIFLYGLGGVVTPFLGIKIIDSVITSIGLIA